MESEHVTLKEYGYQHELDYQYLNAVKVAFKLQPVGRKPKQGVRGVAPSMYLRSELDTALKLIKSVQPG